MKLESLLKPLKIADEEILRQYTKLTKKWEDKGHSKYSLSVIPGFLSLGVKISPIFDLYYLNFPETFLSLIESPASGVNFVHDTIGLITGTHPKGVEDNGNGRIINDKFSFYYEKITKITRMPSFLWGLYFSANGVYNLYDSFVNNDSVSFMEGISNLTFGINSLGLSSSIYIKNSDPKLLDKAPFLKTAYENVKEKIRSLAPQPIPEPALFSENNFSPSR